MIEVCAAFQKMLTDSRPFDARTVREKKIKYLIFSQEISVQGTLWNYTNRNASPSESDKSNSSADRRRSTHIMLWDLGLRETGQLDQAVYLQHPFVR